MKDVKLRIKQARKGAKLTQQALGNLIGVSRGAVSLWESQTAKELPTLDNLRNVASACKVSLGWLVAGDGTNYGDITATKGEIPLLSWKQANHIKEFMQAREVQFENTILCPVEHGPYAFALEVHGNSMTSANPLSKSYPPGTILYCDPERTGEVVSGSPVIAFLEETQESVFKIYIRDAGTSWLRSLNDEYGKILGSFEVRALVIGSFHP